MFQVALNSQGSSAQLASDQAMFRSHVHQGVMEFLRGKTGWVGDPHELSIVARPCSGLSRRGETVTLMLP